MMQPFILISIFVFALIVIVVLVVLAISMRKSSVVSGPKNQEKHPQGYWISVGMSIGAGFGVALGLVFDNLALGIAIGAGFGIAIGSALEQKNKDKMRPLTEQDAKFQKWGVAAGLIILILMVGLFAFLLLSRGV
jgi:hypothetical protein